MGADTPLHLDGKPLVSEAAISMAELAAGRLLTVGRRTLLCLHSTVLGRDAAAAETLGIIGNSDAIRDVRKAILSVADVELPVLIRGATGTGKELVAAAITKQSRRATKPFVAINMGAIPASVAESELFGHAKGGFTGAAESRSGYFGEADGGTLFLDEIGLASAAVQAALLRTIETGEIRPVGAKLGRRVNVRILAATDAQLEERCEAGRFSEPLLHRLKAVQIRLPLLRERRQDIGILFVHFLREFLAGTGELGKLNSPVIQARPWLFAEAMSSVALAAWPGNVRQLRNFAAQLVLANRGAVAARLTPELLSCLGKTVDAPNELQDKAKDRLSRESLLAALERNDFQPARAARDLGVSRTTVYAHMKSDLELSKAWAITDEELRSAQCKGSGSLLETAHALSISEEVLRARLRKPTSAS
jgi:two-component system nitrogen regulation response regulator GlnG